MMGAGDFDSRAVDDVFSENSRPGDARIAESVGARLRALERLDHAALRAEWRRLYRAEPPKRVACELLILGVGWKIQEQAYGGLRGANKRTLAELSTTLEHDGDVTRSRVERLKPGARLIREWHGKSHTVTCAPLVGQSRCAYGVRELKNDC